MKTLIFLIFLMPSICLAKSFEFTWTSTAKGKSETLRYKAQATTRDQAFEQAVDFCMTFFEANPKDEKYVDAIDLCANPKETSP